MRAGHDDWRYTDQRAEFGKHNWWISLFTVFIIQSCFMFAGQLFCWQTRASNALGHSAKDARSGGGVCTGLRVNNDLLQQKE